MIETTEICRLDRKALAALLHDRDATRPDSNGHRRRKVARWPFPGTVELWVPDADGLEHHTLATSLNLSLDGVGIRCDEPLTPGVTLEIAIHEPEVSFHGRATIRHCTQIDDEYLIGLQFLFAQS